MNPGDLVPFGLSMDSVVLILAGSAALCSVFAVWYALLHRDPLAPRLKMLAERRAALKAGLTMPDKRRRDRRQRSIGAMRRVVKALNLARTRRVDRIQLALARAGYRSKDAIVVFLFFKIAGPIIVGAVVVVMLYVLDLYALNSTEKLGVTAVMVLIGVFAPEIFVKNAADKRRTAIRKGLPDGLDLMVICAEAGLGMDASFVRVSRELTASAPELAEEFALTAIELSFLPERRRALENLNARTDMQEIRGVVNTLLQTEKYGTPLANSLRVLAAEFRNERLMRAETKAARLPATLTVPMVVFILPALFVVLIGPAALRTIDALSKM